MNKITQVQPSKALTSPQSRMDPMSQPGKLYRRILLCRLPRSCAPQPTPSKKTRHRLLATLFSALVEPRSLRAQGISRNDLALSEQRELLSTWPSLTILFHSALKKIDPSNIQQPPLLLYTGQEGLLWLGMGACKGPNGSATNETEPHLSNQLLSLL